MNQLIRVLRLIVCLYFGFVSIAAWADSRDDATDAMEVATGRISDATARARQAKRKAALDSQTAIIEKAWSCNPILHEKKIANWKFRQAKEGGELESVEEGYSRLYQTLLEFRSCKNQDDNDQLRKAFLEKYVCGLKSSNHPIYSSGEMDVALKSKNDGIADFEDSIISGVITCYGDSPSGLGGEYMYYGDFKRHEATRQQRNMATRQSQLKSSSVSISSFNDAILFYEPKSLWGVMISPLLKPDNALYADEVYIDREDGSLLLVKFGGGYALGEWVDVAYAALRITKKTKNYSQRAMRIGGGIKVIGRYVQNKKYDDETTMPVIEVKYIGDSD